MGVIMLLAVIAILAGTITPMVFRKMMAAREKATASEMLLLETGLTRFFEDVGRFPSEGEGLAALVNDPGVAGWQGPYVNFAHEEPVAQVQSDAWNLAYAYDLNPTTSPADAAIAVIISGGQNRLVDSGSVGATWTIDGTDDDLKVLVTVDRLNREKTTASASEQELLGRAAQAYFRDHTAYPTGLSQLQDDYLDQGVGSDALVDQWFRSYLLAADNSAVPPTLVISSVGPDGAAGGGDDVSLNLDSVIPGRKTSYYELAIGQAAVTAQTGTDLTGDWTVDRTTFNLAAVLEHDGWGKAYEEKMTTRTLLSAGPDGDYFTPDDNIPPGIIPDDVVLPPTGDGIEYVGGTAVVSENQCTKLTFDITNTSDSDITLTSIKLTWASPTAWYKKVKIDEDVVEQDKPQVGSGDTAIFEESVTLEPGETETVEIESFRSKEWTGGNKVDMSNTDITVEFSDGSTFTFNTGPC